MYRAAFFTFALLTCGTSLACGGSGRYDSFLESALIEETDLNGGWSRIESVPDDNLPRAGGPAGCPIRARKSADYSRRDMFEFSNTVVVLGANHRCLERFVDSATSATSATVAELTGSKCPAVIIRFAPDQAGRLFTSVFVSSNQALSLLNFSHTLLGDESLFTEVAARSCTRLTAAERSSASP